MDESTRAILANAAGSVILLLAFLLLAASAVLLFMLWRGLGVAEPELRRRVALLQRQVDRVQVAANRSAHAVVEPQIRVASAWSGLAAGVRALLALKAEGQRRPPPEPPL